MKFFWIILITLTSCTTIDWKFKVLKKNYISEGIEYKKSKSLVDRKREEYDWAALLFFANRYSIPPVWEEVNKLCGKQDYIHDPSIEIKMFFLPIVYASQTRTITGKCHE